MSASEHSARRSRAASGLEERRLDALLVSSLANIRYLTGFTGSNALVLLLPEKTVFFTDPRYGLQAAQESDCKVRVERGPLWRAAAQWIRSHGIRRLGVEKPHLSCETYLALDDSLPAKAKLVPVADMVETLRMVKSRGEIALIRRSVLANSQAFAETLPRIRPGASELDLATEIEYHMRKLGAEKPAFDTIVASGRRSAMPHASPTSRVLKSGEIVLIDMGAMRDGYASDMTRTLFLGRPSAKSRRLYQAVLEAQLAAIDAVRAGVTAGDIDRAARRALRAEGLVRAFTHATGHGLGLEIHELPKLHRKITTRLETGMAITIEPGVYLQGYGGIRIEDTVVVTRDGCEILTPTPKRLLAL